MQRFGVFAGTVNAEKIVGVRLAVDHIPCEVLGDARVLRISNMGLPLKTDYMAMRGFSSANAGYRAIIANIIVLIWINYYGKKVVVKNK